MNQRKGVHRSLDVLLQARVYMKGRCAQGICYTQLHDVVKNFDTRLARIKRPANSVIYLTPQKPRKFVSPLTRDQSPICHRILRLNVSACPRVIDAFSLVLDILGEHQCQ